MQTPVFIYEIVTLLAVVPQVAMGGVQISGMGYLVFRIQRWLASRSGEEEPDPTTYFRLWRWLFDRLFHPFGEHLVEEGRDKTTNRAVYELVIGIAGVGSLLGVYVLASGAILSSMVISYYTMGFVPDLSSLIDTVAGFCVLAGFAIVIHARERSADVI